MANTRDIPKLVVEGDDDQWVIIGLLDKHGIDTRPAFRPIELAVAKDSATGAKGIIPLLATMALQIELATDRPIGFVVDVDLSCTDRWAEVSKCLNATGIVPPPSCPPEGFIGRKPGRSVDCGVWMMPDCVLDHGKLEHLLKTLVPAGDPLWPLAESSTNNAKTNGATFRAIDLDKATMHCWLAWQGEPGVPFGRAVTSNYFGHDSAEAKAFLRWIKKLYGLTQLTTV
jgi:hypothetical protein